MKHVFALAALLIAVLVCRAPVLAFAPYSFSGGASSPSQLGAKSRSNIADEAIAIYDTNFPFKSVPVKRSPLIPLSLGVPQVDGKTYKNPGKGLSDITEKQAREAFAELSKLYGAESALEMCKAFPLCLALNKAQFSPALKEYAIIFGEDEAKAMVCRNPNLLAVRPAEAAKANGQTMQASYLIAVTRPAGPILLALLAALVLVPVFEGLTGIRINPTLSVVPLNFLF
jgi:hypothetical protein